jgi:4-carboxymuconolactone decarboxylase
VPERLLLLLPGELDDAQRALYEAIVGSPRASSPSRAALRDEQGRLSGPFNALLYSPRIGQAVQQLGTAVRFGSGLTPRAREIAILEVARHAGSGYEWSTHATAGAAAGLTPDEIARIESGRDAASFDPCESTVRSVAQSLLATRDLPDQLYDRAGDLLGEALLVDVVVLVGYYQLLALLLRVARVPAPPTGTGG